MKNIVIICFVLLAGFIGKSQEFTLENLSPDLHFLHNNKRNIIAAGNDGVLMYSSDEGVSWKQKNFPSRNSFLDIYTGDNNQLLALFNNNRMQYSQDFGDTWVEIITPNDAITCTILANGIVVGDKGGNLHLYSVKDKSWTMYETTINSHILDMQLYKEYSLMILSRTSISVCSQTSLSSTKKIRSHLISNPKGNMTIQQNNAGLYSYAVKNVLYFSYDLVSWDSIVSEDKNSLWSLSNNQEACNFSLITYSLAVYCRVSVYSLIDKQLLKSENLDSVYNETDKPYINAEIPTINNSCLVNGSDIMICGNTKLLYKYHKKQWSQISLAGPKMNVILHIEKSYIIAKSMYGVVQSKDGGVTWKTGSKSLSPFGGINYVWWCDIGDNKTQIAIPQGARIKFFSRSIDSGNSFSLINTQIPNWIPNIHNFYDFSIQSYATGQWLATYSFDTLNYAISSYKKLPVSFFAFSEDDGLSWRYKLYDSIVIRKKPFYLSDGEFYTVFKYKDSLSRVYTKPNVGDFKVTSKGCSFVKFHKDGQEIYRLPQPNISDIEIVYFFTKERGLAVVGYWNKRDSTVWKYLSKTSDGGKTWQPVRAVDTVYKDYVNASYYDRSTKSLYISCYEYKVAGSEDYRNFRIEKWSENGDLLSEFTLPPNTVVSSIYPLSPDTLLVNMPTSLYRMILKSPTGIVESRLNDYETPLWIFEPYPNPTTTSLTVPMWIYQAGESTNVSLKLYSIAGFEVADLTNTFSQKEYNKYVTLSFDISQVSSGVYVLKAEGNNNKISNTRIVVKY